MLHRWYDRMTWNDQEENATVIKARSLLVTIRSHLGRHELCGDITI